MNGNCRNLAKHVCRDSFDHISLMEDTLVDIRKANLAGGNYAGQFVVYDLPDRDCAAAASNGEYSLDNDGANKYKNYIQTIKKIIQSYSDIRILLVIGWSYALTLSDYG